MFTTKNKELFSINKPNTPVKENAFIKAATKKSAQTNNLGNGALKHTTTGNDFIDQFAKASAYKVPRTYEEISKDMSSTFSQNKLRAIQLLVYLRLITRTIVFDDNTKTEYTQRGQGLKHEGIFRMIWLAINAYQIFWKNITLFIVAGSWKDIITMLQYDLVYNGWKDRKLDWDNIGKLILAGLENPNTSELVKKYLPQIKANNQCTTVNSQADNIIAKWICSLIFGKKEQGKEYTSYSKYRKLKTSGKAHEWQKLISQRNFISINFNSIHGRALAQLVSSKFLRNQGLEEKYLQWIESKPVAKYTGYVYELLSQVKIGYRNADLKPYQVMTINKQFAQLIEIAKNGMKEEDSGLLVVVDTSSSMTSPVPGTKVSAYSVAKSMALYFSFLLKGIFSGNWAEFANGCKMNKWIGNTPVEMLQNDHAEAYGSTNFQSIAKLFVHLLKDGVSEKDFPNGILCISDGCFNNTNTNKSNFDELINNLKNGGFSENYINNFKVILWDVPNNYYGKTQQAFEDFADRANLYHIGGLDPAAIAFITGVEGKSKSIPKNSEELFEAAMDQEILQRLEI